MLDEVLEIFLMSSPFLATANIKFGYNKDGEKICYSQREKDEFDQNESLDLSALWAKYHGRFLETDIGCYLSQRGLVTVYQKDQHSSPEFNWKEPQEIDWLKNHVSTKSILHDGNYYKKGDTVNFHLPPRYVTKG